MSNSFPDGVSSSGQKKNRQTGLDWNPIGADAQSHRDVHGKSDVDSGPDALHHTLGRGAFQAAPGGLAEMTAIVGQTFMWFANTPPKGFIVLNGQELSRTDYAELWQFAVENNLVGTPGGATGGETAKPFGYGDGSTTFTVPDLVYRVPIGVSSSAGGSEGLQRSNGSKAPRWSALKLTHSHEVVLDSVTGTTDTKASVEVSGNTSSAGLHNHGNTDYGGSHTHYFSTSVGSNSVNVADGTGKTPAGSGHNHDGFTGSDGYHNHAISSDGNHSHTFSGTVPAHSHSTSYTPGTVVVSEDSYLNEYVRTGLDPTPSSIGMGSNLPFFPHLLVMWVMRYTSLFDFEGTVQPVDPRI